MRGRVYLPGDRPRERGFTLVEVLVVVALVGLLLGVAVVSFNRAAAHWEIEAAARLLASDIRAAQQKALAEGTATAVRFYRDAGYYEQHSGGAVRGAVYLPVRVRFAKLTFPAVAAGVYELHFAASGNPGGTGTAYLTNYAGEYRAVRVLVGTGRVRVTAEAP
ncbi:type II secretion system protein H [Thermodesulfitimonas autotrophica]|uniref:Type II secretion system protein H n=1 Tax=Thermodesulfitimonas autotrophica TaxID=1894989 RepID=A0A3N5AW82_9THEO|nr:prepilin-type N-terminal cleavage/methylation domain-containing protein [Thermodesulfitimonas autotrophica]RPF49224.1 type II secretion system protein H [Thermodesulfitimonas autotrophica]